MASTATIEYRMASAPLRGNATNLIVDLLSLVVEHDYRRVGQNDLLAGRVVDVEPVEVYADSWFEFEGADRVRAVEHSIQVTSELALSLLWWKDENILLELDGDAEERGRERSGSVP